MKKSRSLILSCVVILMCVTLVAAGSFALFSDSITVGTHLQAGTLDITLNRTKLVSKALNDEGYIAKLESTEVVDFSKATTRNVFDISDTTLIAPGSSFEATMQIKNDSEVAFVYWVAIVLKDGSEELAKQLGVSVDTASTDVTGALLSNGVITVGSETAPIGEIAKDAAAQEFKVTVSFLNLENNTNNLAQNTQLLFDLVVYAVQKTDAPQQP